MSKSAEMELSVLRNKLHEYIEQADQPHLNAIYVLIAGESDVKRQYDEQTLDMFYQRREKHMKGESKSLTVDESLALIRGRN